MYPAAGINRMLNIVAVEIQMFPWLVLWLGLPEAAQRKRVQVFNFNIADTGGMNDIVGKSAETLPAVLKAVKKELKERATY